MHARSLAGFGARLSIGLALIAASEAFSAQKPAVHTNASVKLWLDTGGGNACEQSTPASGDWMIRNNEGRDVLVTIRRRTTKAGVSREDEVRDTLEPRESRDLGCETTDEAHQTLTLIRAIY